MQLIKRLLNVCQDRILDLLELIFDLAVLFLIHFYLFKDKVALTAAGVHENICLGTPSKLIYTWLNYLIETCKVLSEQLFLVLVDEQDNVIVVAHNQHHILTQLPESVSFRILTRQRRWDLQRVEGLHFIPILHLDQIPQELGAKVAREKASHFILLEKWVSLQDGVLLSL